MIYLGDLSEVTTPFLPPEEGNKFSYAVFHLYELKCNSKKTRDDLKDFLESKNICCGLHYPIPCHKQPVYSSLNAYCPLSSELANTLLSLPMHPNLSKDKVIYVCQNIIEFFNK